jgi:hypothetical protein
MFLYLRAQTCIYLISLKFYRNLFYHYIHSISEFCIYKWILTLYEYNKLYYIFVYLYNGTADILVG